tara:strand:- start:132 stop:374 length:243 start_codon:yes stop_codon:yes gene_type:complete
VFYFVFHGVSSFIDTFIIINRFNIDYYFYFFPILIMNGKKFLIFLMSFLVCFAVALYLYMYLTGWFDIFLDSGFKGLYGK